MPAFFVLRQVKNERYEMEKLLLLENPFHPGRNPRSGRKKRRNPRMARALALPKTVREWTQGIGIPEAAAAFGGLSATTILPGMLVRDTSTVTGKALKIGAGILSAGAAGALGKSMFDQKVGRAAVIGGMAGVFSQVIAMLGIVQLGGRRVGSVRAIGEGVIASPAVNRQDETVSLINP